VRSSAAAEGPARGEVCGPSANTVKIQDISVGHTTTRPGHFPDEAIPEIAFLGRSNVGKSSLINSLTQRRKLARTSKSPGRTQAIRCFRIAGDITTCFFVDLPGYGYAKVSRKIREEQWGKLIETYLQQSPNLLVGIQLLDMRRDGPTKLDWQMIEWSRASEVPTLYVLTKSDKLGKNKRAQAVQAFARALDLPEGEKPIPYSAVTGVGRDELWDAIDDLLRRATESSAA
jgi:GTP-binding protein